ADLVRRRRGVAYPLSTSTGTFLISAPPPIGTSCLGLRVMRHCMRQENGPRVKDRCVAFVRSLGYCGRDWLAVSLSAFDDEVAIKATPTRGKLQHSSERHPACNLRMAERAISRSLVRILLPRLTTATGALQELG